MLGVWVFVVEYVLVCWVGIVCVSFISGFMVGIFIGLLFIVVIYEWMMLM